mgnify:CR=1 FL=1
MVLPTTVLPPTVDELDIQALTNVPMPNVQPAPPRVSPYSASNLPEFMQQRVEVAPGLFGPQQGLLGAAPVGAPADYDALEQQFVESFAARPEYFGRSYTPGAMMPGGLEFAPMSTDKPFDFEEGLKTAALLKAAYDLRKPIKEGIIDPLASGIDDVIFEPIKENVLEPFKEGVVDPFASGFDDAIIQPIKEGVIDPIAESETLKKLADTAVKPVEGIVDFVDELIPPGTGTAIQETKDKFLDAIDLRFNLGTGDTLDNLKKTFEGVSDAVGYIGDIENVISKPSLQTAERAIDAANSLYALLPGKSVGIDSGISIGGQQLAGMEAQEGIITGGLAESLKNVASAANIAQFAKDPTIEGAPVAYESAAQVAKIADVDLPGVDSPYVQKPIAAVSVLNAAKALKGGIDSPGELADVVSGVSALPALGLTPNLALTSAVGATGPVQPLMLSQLGPIAAAAAFTVALPDMLEGGAAGEIPRSKYTLGFEDGRFGETSSRTYDKTQTPIETAKRDFGSSQSRNAIDFVNWLQNSMGYQVDQTALKKWEASDQDEIVDQYGYFEQRHKLKDPSVNAADFVTNMLQAGVLKPTAETPPINMQEALNVLTPDVTYYSDLQDIQVAANVNVPYVLSQINPYPEGFDQSTGYKLTPQQIEQRQRNEQAAQAFIEREPTPPRTIGEFIGSITPQQAMALPPSVDLSQPMPNFMPDLSGLYRLEVPYDPGKRKQAVSVPTQLLNFQSLLGTLPI